MFLTFFCELEFKFKKRTYLDRFYGSLLSVRGIKSIGLRSKKLFGQTSTGGTKAGKYFINRGRTKVDRAPQGQALV